jgi:hypothetical protein
MKDLFWNRREARIRAGWRVVLFVVASSVASTALAGPGRRALGRLLPVVYANLVEVVVLVLLIRAFLWMAARWLDRRPVVDYGFHLSRAWWLDLGFGLALGVFLMAGVYALALAIGWVKAILGQPMKHPQHRCLRIVSRSLIGERAAQKVAMRERCALLLGRGDTAGIRLKRKGPWALPA